MRNKMIDLLDEVLARYRFDAWENTDKIADHLLAHGVVVQEWIPVSEPPKETSEYLVYTQHGDIATAGYIPSNDLWVCDRFIGTGILYWMPLPDEPKGE